MVRFQKSIPRMVTNMWICGLNTSINNTVYIRTYTIFCYDKSHRSFPSGSHHISHIGGIQYCVGRDKSQLVFVLDPLERKRFTCAMINSRCKMN